VSAEAAERDNHLVADRIVNPFVGDEAAALYRRGRLHHHEQAIAAVLKMVGGRRAGRALDLGCGTGLSTTALAAMADFAVGLDAAPAMVGIATSETGMSCVVALAETTPFRDSSFDAVTVASTFHWVDQERLFEESRRLLRSGGWLAIYDHGLVGLEKRPDFINWVKDVYLIRYPAPFRGAGFGPRSEMPAGFRSIGHATYEDPREMTCEQFVGYHLSQSIALMGTKARGETVAAARAWLETELSQFIPADTTSSARFVGSVSCLALCDDDSSARIRGP